MRELTKSTLSAGLAMSLFGMQTMLNLLRRQQSPSAKPAQESIETVTQTLLENTGNTLRESFQAGDKIQRGLVDMTFRILTLSAVRPGSNGASTISDAARQATDRVRSWMSDSIGRGRGDCGCADRVSPSPQWAPFTSSSNGNATRAPKHNEWGQVPDAAVQQRST